MNGWGCGISEWNVEGQKQAKVEEMVETISKRQRPAPCYINVEVSLGPLEALARYYPEEAHPTGPPDHILR